jgi:dCTP deaminase
MILTGPAIRAAIANGSLRFSPFDAAALNPNSIDIHLGDTLLQVAKNAPDAAPTRLPLDAQGRFLEPGQLYLIDSRESFGSDTLVPMVHGKSNIARAGLFVHANGEMIDLGAFGPYQFQLFPVLPIRVFAGMAVAQVTFWTVQT